MPVSAGRASSEVQIAKQGSTRQLVGRVALFGLGIAVLVLVACTEASATPTPQLETPTVVVPTATLTATPVPIPTPVPSPTPTPSPTPVPATPTPRPTATPIPPTPTPTPIPVHFENGEPTQALLDELELWEVITSELRGVSPDSEERDRTFLTRDEFVEQSDQQQSESEAELTPEEQATADEGLESINRLLRTLGLIEASADVIEESNLVLGDAVGGFFNTETRELNVILDEREGSFGANDIRIYVHEYMHLLQEVGFDTFDARDGLEDDAILAITSFTEGEAEFFAQLVIWHVRGREYLESAFDEEPVASDPSSDSDEGSEAAPEPDFSYYLEQSFAFPYSTGIDFFAQMILPMTPFPQTLSEFPPDTEQVAANFAVWSDRLNEIHDRLPVSTEQVLHSEKYRANELPIDVEIASTEQLLEGGWTELVRSDWGEGGLKTWLEAVLNEGLKAGESDSRGPAGLETAAAGWGGDQLLVIRSECGEFASTTLIEWDEPELDTAEFASEFDFWYGRNDEFTSVPSGNERVVIKSGPSGFLAINTGADEQKTAIVTADTPETAESLVLWLLGEIELTNNCAPAG